MHVDWEALTAIATLLSAAAVVPAVIIGLRQVRIGAQAIQLEGTMKIFEMLSSPEQRKGRLFIATELGDALADERFRSEVSLVSAVSTTREHPELPVLQLMEMVGTYVKHGLLDQRLVFDYISPGIVSTWESVHSLGVIALQRETYDDTLWENYEWRYAKAQTYERKRSMPSKR